MKSKKLNGQPERSKKITYKCLKCSYVFSKEWGELPPTFCPNCAVNHLKGEIISIMKPLDYEAE